MVNKCSVAGCISLYSKKKDTNVKLHRFPLTNAETLPIWVAATGREKGWKPCKSSRLCGNHFQESEYIVGHGKGILKATAIPTIDYRVDTSKLKKNKYLYSHNNMGQINKLVQVESMDNHPNVEIVQLNYYDIYDSKCEQQNKDVTDNTSINNEESYDQNEYEEAKTNTKIPNDNKQQNSANFEDNQMEEDDYENEDSNHYESTQNEHKTQDSNSEIKNICNRENQCYMFTSSFKEGVEPIILPSSEDKPFEGPLSMNIEKSKAELNFKRIMALKLKREKRTKDIYTLYFKSLKKKQHNNINSDFDDTGSFGAFIEAQMKELRPYKKLYLTTKHKIQKLIMNAQEKLLIESNVKHEMI